MRGVLTVAVALAQLPVASMPVRAQPARPRATVFVAPSSGSERALVQQRAASAVALAVGNVGALLTDADVLFYNPAMLPQARGVAASLQRDERGAANGALASVQAVGGLGVGIGARLATVPRGASISSSVALTAGVARAVGPVRLGLAGTYAREAERDATTVDVAAALPFGPGNALGVTAIVQHLGPSIARDRLGGEADPWRAVVAIGGRNYQLATFWDLSGYTQVAIDADGTTQLAAGAELAWVPLEGVAVALRGGARGARDARPLERPLTGGLGVTIDRWSVDYAVEYDPEPRAGGRALHRVGLRVR